MLPRRLSTAFWSIFTETFTALLFRVLHLRSDLHWQNTLFLWYPSTNSNNFGRSPRRSDGILWAPQRNWNLSSTPLDFLSREAAPSALPPPKNGSSTLFPLFPLSTSTLSRQSSHQIFLAYECTISETRLNPICSIYPDSPPSHLHEVTSGHFGNGKHLVLGCIGEDILMRQRILHSLVLAPRHICQVRSRDYFSVSLAFQTCKSQQVNKPTADTFYTVADSTASYWK